MTHRIVFSPRSRRDLENIRAYLAAESETPALAIGYLGRLLDACDSLKVLPARFAPYPYARSWRMMPFDYYLVFFQVQEGDVRIGHIRHGARRPFKG